MSEEVLGNRALLHSLSTARTHHAFHCHSPKVIRPREQVDILRRKGAGSHNDELGRTTGDLPLRQELNEPGFAVFKRRCNASEEGVSVPELRSGRANSSFVAFDHHRPFHQRAHRYETQLFVTWQSDPG